MESATELRIGSILVTRDGRGRFHFQDARDPDLRELPLDEALVPELIKFLHQWSATARRLIRLDYVSELEGPHLLDKPDHREISGWPLDAVPSAFAHIPPDCG